MQAERKPAFSPFLRYVELRASRIEDPVERLKYLRRMMALPALGWSLSPRLLLGWTAPAAAVVILLALPWRTAFRPPQAPTALASRPRAERPAANPVRPAQGPVWQVDRQSGAELYSNGLRIERRNETRYLPRKFLAFPRAPGKEPEPRKEPVGIVFHTTESAVAPFESKHNQSLRRFGEGLLSFARQEQLYHFVVDRFGRVHRIVQETDVANHAGHSAWADEDYLYVKLNQSFLGVAFEGKSAGNGDEPIINEAQVHAARLLSWMLRERYHLRPENCVTHAQVSLAPVARRIGYHTDWAANFPFGEVGLPDNYRLPVAGLEFFGFEYDPDYMALAAPELALSIKQTDARLAKAAREKGLTLAQHRAALQKDFVRLSEAMRQFAFAKETD